MTEKETMLLLEPWAEQFHTLSRAYEPLAAALKLSPENPLHEAMWSTHEAMWSTFDRYTDTLERLLGDESGWLDWYCWENAMGERGHQAGPIGRKRTIRGLHDLVWLIRGEV